MDIERIDGYADARFDSEILRQHGAFLVDGRYACGFKIIGIRSAVFVGGCPNIDEVIEIFRFFAGHITKFYDENGGLIKEFPPVRLFDLNIEMIQPSQFYADSEKLAAVDSFVFSSSDIVVPVVPYENRFISEDGHTRLVCAYRKGIKCVKAFVPPEKSRYIIDFAKLAIDRGVFSVKDIVELSHSEYEVKWHKFCRVFFDSRQ